MQIKFVEAGRSRLTFQRPKSVNDDKLIWIEFLGLDINTVVVSNSRFVFNRAGEGSSLDAAIYNTALGDLTIDDATWISPNGTPIYQES